MDVEGDGADRIGIAVRDLEDALGRSVLPIVRAQL
jgi:hypothetical protein